MAFRRGAVSSLLDWYRRHRRLLPWRQTADPYRIWVSEVMLQQTRVETAIAYYQRWMEALPDVRALAASDEQKVLKLWEGLGYYGRARHLRRAARLLVERYGGRIPADPRAIRELPGIGDYIAAAVLSIAYGVPEGVVDGNVIRVTSRLLADGADSSSPAFRRRIKALVEASFFDFPPGEVNQAWMELGALVCKPRPACPACPLRSRCRARAQGRETDFPVKPPRRAAPLRRGIILWLQRSPGSAGSPLLLVRRESRGLLGGLWELPNWELGGEPGETAGLEELFDRRGIRLLEDTGREVRHGYSHFAIRSRIYRAGFEREQPLAEWVEQRWVLPRELSAYPRPRLHIRAMERLGLD